MKLFTLITLMALSSSAMAQQKKTVVKTVTKTEVTSAPIAKPVADSVIARKQAEDYFRTIYVEATFKDPYSYKLLKCSVMPVTKLESYTDSLKISKDLQLDNDTTKGMYPIYMEYYYKYEKSYLKKMKSKRDTITAGYDKKDADKYKAKADEVTYSYNKGKYGQKKYEGILRDMTDVDKIGVFTYKIYLDCYAKNSLGGQVLGRYVFYYRINVGALSTPIKYND